MSERRTHWERVYEQRAPDAVSWFQEEPATSLALIERAGIARADAILDVGGGASTLAGALLARGYTDVSVLDLSERALEHARARLGARASEVTWIRADVTEVELDGHYRLWHDRAVFHFLTEERDRARYRALLHRVLEPGGQAIVATFALDGPERCSGLPVVRYAPETLRDALGGELLLEEAQAEEHLTPAGGVQRFVFCRLRRP